MSAAMMVLPVLWAMEAPREEIAAGRRRFGRRFARRLVFYREHTEGLLRRYVRLSMEAGRAPSLLGRDMFRGNVTHYRVRGFDDVVIFVHDVEQCLMALDDDQRALVERIALQEYTHHEAAELLRLPQRTASRWYWEALDRLTESFLERKLLIPVETCQVAEIEEISTTH